MAAKAPVLGKQSKADLPDALFSEPFHESLVHEAARADLASRRRGTHSTLTRGEVSMTTAKAWRQKGTGRARAGALSVPHRYGGAAAFGPKPRHYTFKVNRKARRRALRAALTVHAERGTIAVVDAAGFKQPSTKQAAKAIESWGAKSPTLVLLAAEESAAFKSFRNIPAIVVLDASSAGVADVIGAASLVVSQAALENLAERTTDGEAKSKPKAAAKAKPKAPAKAEAKAEVEAEPEADAADEPDSKDEGASE
ncbi:MAG: 50S ribosomal protein L4 [Solirubrobacterales bacterium]|nr:50S ribosomal protein L4 [Solirubrobacterales bacterium]